MAGSAVTLGGIYAYYKYKSRALELEKAIKRGVVGEGNDKEVCNIRQGSLHILLHCSTDESFLDVLEDFNSGRMKERLQEKFFDIGIETFGLVVEIENIAEVTEKAAAIRER